MLSFTLLGQVSLYKDGTRLSQFRSQKEAALLIYLAQTGQAHSRDFIADLLWDNRTTKQALSNLRTVLARLRKQVGDALIVTRKSLELAPESRQQVDAVILLQALAKFGSIDTFDQAQSLEKTLDAYQGNFLPDFYLSDAHPFDEWVTATRAHIHRQVVASYEKLGQYARETRNAKDGIAIARRWLQVDALDETANTLLVQSLRADGQVNSAIAHYNHYADLLQIEVGVTPPTEMTALMEDVQQTPVVVETPVSKVHHNLSAPYDQFFGRETAQQDIHARLDQPWCRLVTIVGQGGVGKTRLATTVARSRLNHYQDGVWLVELAEIDPDDGDLKEAIAVEIATVLDLRLSGSEKPVEQLLTHLQHKPMLLVLDNFEHLLEDGTSLVLDLLQRCENLQLIVTSREALRIRAEWTITLTGLGYPTDDSDEIAYEAVDLFTARRAQHRQGVILADEFAAIRQICRMVEGVPLAVELAAALTTDITLQDIADDLRGGFDALKTSLRDVPQRHQSLQLVFTMSWRTLTPDLQQRLAQLTVFRGGFSEAAAHEIADATPQQLAALAEKSLLSQETATGRYTLHAVIRSFAARKRHSADATPQKHAHFYLSLLAQHTEPLQKATPQRSMAVIEPDITNVRLAWQTGITQDNVDLLSAALTSLSIYYQLRGLAREGEAVMQSTLNSATAWGDIGVQLATRAGLERARFQIRLGRYRPAIQTIDTTLKLADQCADPWAEGMGHVLWSEALWRLGEYDLAQKKLTHALDIAHTLDDTMLLGWCHHHLGVINDIQSRYDAAHDHLQQACAAWRVIDNVQALSGSLNSMGLVCYNQGDLSAAQQAMEEALTLCNQLDDRHRQATLINNLSMISTEKNDYLGAHHYLQLGLELAISSGNSNSQGEINNNLGKNYLLLGKTSLAVEHLEKGLQISDLIENRFMKAVSLVNLANVEKKQGGLKQAQSQYIEALRIARQDNLQYIECEALIGMAELLGKRNEGQARQYSTQAISLAETLQNQDLLKRATAIDHYLNVSADVDA